VLFRSVDSLCAETGTAEKLILERSVTMSATLVLEKHEAELYDRLLNNTDTKIMANFGPKDGSGNWIPGKCVNIYLPSASIVGHVVADNAGYLVIELTANAFVTTARKDIYINFV